MSTYTIFWMTRAGLARDIVRHMPDVDDLVSRLQRQGISDILAAEGDQRPIGFQEWRKRYGATLEQQGAG